MLMILNCNLLEVTYLSWSVGDLCPGHISGQPNPLADQENMCLRVKRNEILCWEKSLFFNKLL